MSDKQPDVAILFTEMYMGAAILAALIFHVIEKKGLVSGDEITSAIREAGDQIPDEYAAEPRYASLVALQVLLDDPKMRHATPFPWPPNSA